ncbi:Gfo/Idh/MocA family protein [Rubripirellula reticaptiva]|uniref:1,5-anhydro-D-fructose reductase n=1 Tax=Rubripirellula reticaptiva TaxID=2528013 RepID=A0A5C6F4P0_9BACT|nr:Gfo/Idh/MocA family oxidoreductase [Rubripirellula reticaptiva]TWU56165.1 1,5-anhydro-D-fructose reductase [Rubripirellula reticaptiva]
MTTSSTRFGVIGTGRITRRLVADLQSTDGAVVTAIASRSRERARWYGDQYGIDAAVEGYAELLKRDDVDAVYISLPPSMHAEWAIAAANHGKHVLCEKPLTVSVAQTRQVDLACQAAGVRWLDATGWLHHDRTDAFATWLGEGRFGKIGHVSAAVSFYQPFQSGDHRLDASLGGGCILDLGWYAGGLVRFAMGRMPAWVLADEVILDGVSQRLTAMMGFDDGATATISCGYDTATRKWFEVAGTESSLICDDFTRPWADRPARYWIHDAAGTVKSESFDGHQERNMIKRLISDEPLLRYQQQAIDTQAIVEAVQASIKAGGTKFVLSTMTD